MKTYKDQMAAVAARSRRYRERHPDRKRESNRKWRTNNLEASRLATSRWYKANREHRIEQECARAKGLPVPSIKDLRARDAATSKTN